MVSASVKLAPVAIWLTVLPASAPSMFTATGTEELVRRPRPSWPVVPTPHPKTFPSLVSINVALLPGAMAVTVLPASTPVISTATGTGRLVVELSPSWPKPL